MRGGMARGMSRSVSRNSFPGKVCLERKYAAPMPMESAANMAAQDVVREKRSAKRVSGWTRERANSSGETCPIRAAKTPPTIRLKKRSGRIRTRSRRFME
jgi:hypothetical protein